MFSSPMMHDGIVLLCYGMGAVFVFLTVLFLATALMSACVRAWLSGDGGARPAVAEAVAGRVPRRHVGAIMAAVHRYRRRSSPR